MPQEGATKGYRCDRCDSMFTSQMRLEHHKAADHAAKTSRDIRTRKDVRTGSDISRRPSANR